MTRSRDLGRGSLVLISALVLASGTEAQPIREAEKPVVLGGSALDDACASLARVVAPVGRKVAPVYRGPSATRYARAGRLRSGTRVFVCASEGRWSAIVFGRTAGCGVS